MAAITITVPEDLAERLKSNEDQSEDTQGQYLFVLKPRPVRFFAKLEEVMAFLAELPGPQEVLSFRPSPALDRRIRELLEKNRNEGLTPAEESEFDEFDRADHLLAMARITALQRLNAVPVNV